MSRRSLFLLLILGISIVALGLAPLAGCGGSAPPTSEKSTTTTGVSAITALAASTTTTVAPASTTLTPSTTAAAVGPSSGQTPHGGGMQGADTSSIKTQSLDVAYADASESQKLDIYLPNSGSGPFPVIVAIHGGAFLMGDKADGQLTPMLAGLDRGYAVVSINYRLSNEAKFPAQINDVKAAIRFVRANAGTYGLDPNKIAAWGGSSGGYLAAMLGTSGGVADLEDTSQGSPDQSSAVRQSWIGSDPSASWKWMPSSPPAASARRTIAPATLQNRSCSAMP